MSLLHIPSTRETLGSPGPYQRASQSDGPERRVPKIRRTTMTQEKMNQVQIEAIELTDDQLEMVTGGKGRPGGGSLIRDGWQLIRRLIEKITEPSS